MEIVCYRQIISLRNDGRNDEESLSFSLRDWFKYEFSCAHYPAISTIFTFDRKGKIVLTGSCPDVILSVYSACENDGSFYVSDTEKNVIYSSDELKTNYERSRKSNHIDVVKFRKSRGDYYEVLLTYCSSFSDLFTSSRLYSYHFRHDKPETSLVSTSYIPPRPSYSKCDDRVVRFEDEEKRRTYIEEINNLNITILEHERICDQYSASRQLISDKMVNVTRDFNDLTDQITKIKKRSLNFRSSGLKQFPRSFREPYAQERIGSYQCQQDIVEYDIPVALERLEKRCFVKNRKLNDCKASLDNIQNSLDDRKTLLIQAKKNLSLIVRKISELC